MKMSEEERRERRRQKQKQLRDENELAARTVIERQNMGKPSRRDLKTIERAEEIRRMLEGAEFKRWYEATTGEEVGRWLRRTRQREIELHGGDFDWFEWMERRIKKIA